MTDVTETLQKNPLFQDLEADELAELTQRLVHQQFPSGTKILEEGYGGLNLYVLMEGRVKIFRKMGDRQILITTLNPPQTFGEISIIDGEPASATVEAEDDVVVLSLHRDDFYELMDSSWTLQAKVMRNLLREMCGRIRTTTNQVQDYFAINQALCENENFRNFYKLFGP